MKRDYFLGAFIDLLFFGFMLSWFMGWLGLPVPWFIAHTAIFLPIFVPALVFLALRRRSMAIGALIAGAATFVISIVLPF